MKNIKRVKWFTSKTQANERMSNDKKDEQQKQKNGIRNERLIGFVLRRQRRYLCSHLLKSMYTCTVYAFMRTVKIGRDGGVERGRQRKHRGKSKRRGSRCVDTIRGKIIFLSLCFVHRATPFNVLQSLRCAQAHLASPGPNETEQRAREIE